VVNFVQALAQGDEQAALRTLSPSAPITLGDTDPLDVAELAEQLGGGAYAKIIGSGSTVAVSLSSAHGRGILFADVAWRGSQITRVRYFPS
jgi:hypothetical protein